MDMNHWGEYQTVADWWENFAVPIGSTGDSANKLLAENVPPISHFEYLLYTDGSGCTKGWGAYAAIAHHAASDRHILKCGANYGETVQRNEMRGLLAGLHAIADHRIAELDDLDLLTKSNNMLGNLRDISVLWCTDRQNLASSMILDTEGGTVNRRVKDVDLWQQLRAYEKHMTIVPLHAGRNSVDLQAKCDEMCDAARTAFKELSYKFENILPFDPQCSLPKVQKARF